MPFASPSVLRPAALLAVLVLAVTAYAVAPASADGAVTGALQGAFHPTTGGTDAAATELTAYDGEPLSVQAVDVGRRSAEPTVAVTTDGTAFFAAANFDSVGGVGARTELLRSADGGVSWESVQQTLPVVKSFPPANLDPYVWVDTGTDRVFNLDLTGCGTLQYSDDNGETFTPAVAACGDSVDHQSLFGGPPAPDARLPQVGYPNTVYYCSNRVLDSRCGRSLDGGRTWITTATPAYPGFDPAEGGICNGLHGHGIVDPEGRIILPKGHCEFPYVSVSEDGGDTWTRTRVSDVKSGETILEPFEYAGTYAHTSVASDAAGNLYYVWPGPDRRAYLAISRDHGATWSEPLNITPPGVTEVNFPTVAAGDDGRIAVTLVGGFAEEPPGVLGGGDPQRPWNHYVMASTDALTQNPLFVLTTSHDASDPIHRGDCFARCGGMYDFLDVIVAPAGEIWATASDTCVQAECTAPDGEVDPDAVGVGIAIRQLGGPQLIADEGT